MMKYTISFISLTFFVMTVAVVAQEAELLVKWKFGYATLYRIEDTVSAFMPETFPAVERVTFDKYATDGKIPSSVSAFLLEYPSTGHYVLIDAGMGSQGGNLMANLEKVMSVHDQRNSVLHKEAPIGYQPERIALVLLTHMHGDHIGGLLDGDARRFPNAKVYCSPQEYDYWSKQGNAAFERLKKAYGDDFCGGFTFGEGFALGGEEELELISIEENKTLNDSRVTIVTPDGREIMGNWHRRGFVTVTPLNAAGHTPGHAVFLIESQGEKLMVVGDLLHAAALQFPVPEACARFDMDPPEAVKARRRVLDKAAEENIPVAGMHFPNSGLGFVKKNADDGYDFSPMKKTLYSSSQKNATLVLIAAISLWYKPLMMSESISSAHDERKYFIHLRGSGSSR